MVKILSVRINGYKINSLDFTAYHVVYGVYTRTTNAYNLDSGERFYVWLNSCHDTSKLGENEKTVNPPERIEQSFLELLYGKRFLNQLKMVFLALLPMPFEVMPLCSEFPFPFKLAKHTPVATDHIGLATVNFGSSQNLGWQS